jgi:haloalkane dehalogenase
MDRKMALDLDIQVGGKRVHAVRQGEHGRHVVLLHGLPAHAGMWRRVQSALAHELTTTAFDLPGFGKSEPIDRQDDLAALTDVLDAALDSLEIHEPIFVALDLGLLVALQWTTRYPNRVPAIVMMEGFFLPMEIGWKALSISSRFLMRLAQSRWLAKRAIVDDDKVAERFLRAGVVRRLNDDELAQYTDPWRDRNRRRKVWLQGINAGVLIPPSRRKGDTVDLIDKAAIALERSAMPKLLLTADPGMIVTAATVDNARQRLPNLKVVGIGAGKHFLPEDQPEAIAHEVGKFVGVL